MAFRGKALSSEAEPRHREGSIRIARDGSTSVASDGTTFQAGDGSARPAGDGTTGAANDSPTNAPARAARKGHIRRVLAVLALGQLPALFVLWRALDFIAPESSSWWTAASVLYLALGLRVYLRHVMPERPMPSSIRIVLVYPLIIWLLLAVMVLPIGTLSAIFLAIDALGQSFLGIDGTLGQWVNPVCFSAFLGALCITAYGTLVRSRWVRLEKFDIPLRGLPPGADGFKIAHISDLHVGNFAQGRRLRRWLDRVNALEPDLIAVTGDLISSGDTYVSQVVEALSKLRAPHGVVVSLGNHDYWCSLDSFVRKLREADIRVLRNEGYVVEGEGGAHSLFLAGVEDEWSGEADIKAALRERPTGLPVVLFSHSPSLAPEAFEAKVGLTLSGHTHGGQLAVPFFPKWHLSARAYQFGSGLYEKDGCFVYVNRGLGTTGPPFRLGAAPEIALLKLRVKDG